MRDPIRCPVTRGIDCTKLYVLLSLLSSSPTSLNVGCRGDKYRALQCQVMIKVRLMSKSQRVQRNENRRVFSIFRHNLGLVVHLTARRAG